MKFWNISVTEQTDATHCQSRANDNVNKLNIATVQLTLEL